MRRIFKKLLAPVMVLGLSITLWACTSKSNSKIIFESNDGSHVAESTTKVETEPVPTKKGYVFEGWYTTIDFKDEKVTFPFDLGKEDITLYAKWKLENYTITYHLNGGTNHASNPNSYTVETAVTLNNPTHATKDFDGWYSDAEFKTAVSSIAKGSIGNVNLYAKWKDKVVVSETYDITYHLDGGTNANENPVSYTKGTAITLLAATKLGHKFEGWYTEDSFTNKVTGVSAEDTGNKAFYAKFVVETYTITYNLNDGVNAASNPASYTFGTAVTLADATKEGYTFAGWYKEAEFTNKVTGVSAEDTGNQVFYAKFVAEKYTITYHLDGGTNSSKNPATYTVADAIKLATPTKDRMVFRGWYTDAEFKNRITEITAGTEGNLDLYAKWEEVAFVITYHLDDGDNHHDNPAGYSTGHVVTFEPATKLGYKFDGWYTDANFQNKITGIAEDSSGDLDLYAKFTLENYLITYHLNGGTNTGTNPASYNVASAVVLAAASKAGYKFDGWYSEASFTNKVTGIASGTTGAKEFYAKFTNDYELMYGTWSKDNYMLFASLTAEAITYNGASYAYTMTDFTSNKITAGNEKIYFTYNPAADTITFVREYFRNEDDLDPSLETLTLNRITVVDTQEYAGTYYTGDSRIVKDLVLDANGHVTRFDGADTYQGFFTVEDSIITIEYKTNNQGSLITYVGTIENGVLKLTKDDVVSVYVKNDNPTVYSDNVGNVVYKYTNLYVLEKNHVDYIATMTGEFAVGNLVTFTYADTSVKFRVASLAGASWGTLESAGQHAGEYTFSDSEDVLVLDGFGPTNGKLGDAKLNDTDVSYAMVGYMQNMLVILADATEKYYQMDGRVLTEVTVSDGMQGKFVSNVSESSYYEVSGLGYYKRSGADYYDKYEYNSSANTIKLNSTTYTIYHNGNVLSTGTSHYVKEGYDVTTKDFTDYVDVVYENTDNQIKVRVTNPSGAYKVVVLEAVTLNGVEFSAITYDAVYVLDRLVFNGVELVLSDSLDLVVAEETYTLTEFVPEKTLAEKVVGVYVNGNYYVRVYDDEGTLKACYGTPNSYGQPSTYTCTITDEDNNKLQFTPYSSAYDFTYSEIENVGRITFGSSSGIDSSYRGKEFVAYDDSTVELRAVSGASITAGGYAPGASSLAKIYENNELKSWTNISYSQTLTAEERNTVGVLDVELYAWVYGKKYTVVSQLTITESWDLTASNKSIYETEENYTKADIIALDMFTPKHNGAAVEVTEDMLTLPTGFDTTKAGSYTITCTYHEMTKTATLTVNANPAGHYNYTSGENNSYYGTYFSAGLDVEMVDGKLNLTVGTTTLTNIKSGNTYVINTKDVTITIANDKVTLSADDSSWNTHSTVYTKEKEVDVTKYVGLYVNGNCYVRLFAEDKKLKVYYGASINPYSDPVAYDCTITDDDAGAVQFVYSTNTNAFTFSENAGQKKITFKSDSSVQYDYRGKEFAAYDDSTVELVGKNYQSKAGTTPSVSNLAVIRENNVDKTSWTNIKFVTNLTNDQKNTLGEQQAELYAWVYGKKHIETITFTVIENYSVSKSNITINTQDGYGKAEIIASGMFTAKHNGVTDTITEDMITLPAGFDSTVVGTYTITCTYYTETVTATLTVRENPAGTYVYSSGNTTWTGYEIYFVNGFTLEEQDNGKYKMITSSKTYENVDLNKSYETPSTYKEIYVTTTETGIRIYEGNYNYYCDYVKQA